MATTINKIIDFLGEHTWVRRLLIVCWHAAGVCSCYAVAFLLRFDGRVGERFHPVFWRTLPVLLVSCLAVFLVFRLYSGLWSYFSVDDLLRVGFALGVAIILFAGLTFTVMGFSFSGYPRSVFAITFLLMSFWMAGGRLLVRSLREHMVRRQSGDEQLSERILVVGKLSDADLILRATRNRRLGQFVAVVSNEAGDQSLTLHGVPVSHCPPGEVGAVAVRAEANCIVILPPFNRPREINEIMASCVVEGVACSFRTIPSLGDLASGELAASSIREVDIKDLLERGTVNMDRSELHPLLSGRNVMVTGAGGSIGRELCRQIGRYRPAVLVLFEISEYALYRVQQILQEEYPDLSILPYAGDIRHPEELDSAILSAGGIDVIYHAAAYKHVPLMEQNVPACFRNNVLGTARLADAAERHAVKRMIMVSSDKAVRPSSIMGACKRIAERLILERKGSRTSFLAVRFGNVLDSSGSVVPLFQRQIAKGGPVTVTTPDVRRFFMTIPEAVDLVMLAGAVGKSGEVMVLEMGNPVRILELAERLIELSGLVPHRDIEIEFIGLRPGEKGHEEVLTDDEDVVRTEYERIWVLSKRGHDDAVAVPVEVRKVEEMVGQEDVQGLRDLAARYVPDHVFSTDTQAPAQPVPDGRADAVILSHLEMGRD